MPGRSATSRTGLATVVLAAGAGKRFGGVKQVAEVGGQPCLTRVLGAVDGFAEDQIVVLGAAAERVRLVIPEADWRVVLCPDWEAGVGASLRGGLRAMGSVDAVLVALGDLPWLRREAVERVLAAAAEHPAAEAVRAFEDGTPGHPLFLRGALLEAARSAPDRGFGAILRDAEVVRVDCSGLGASRDLDHPDDLEARSSDGRSAARLQRGWIGPT